MDAKRRLAWDRLICMYLSGQTANFDLYFDKILCLPEDEEVKT